MSVDRARLTSSVGDGGVSTGYGGLPFNEQILWKVTGECNLRCTYCHHFADESVDSYPPRVSPIVVAQILFRLEELIRVTERRSLTVHYEGGEPLLLGRERFESIFKSIAEIGEKSNCQIHQSLTTNGTQLTPEWISLFEMYDVTVTVSIDGPTRAHNHRRITRSGKDSYNKIVRGLDLVRRSNLRLGCLVVADPRLSAAELLDGMKNDLGLKKFDVLIPKFNHDDFAEGSVQPIGGFFVELFRHWYQNLAESGINVRFCTDVAALMLGISSYSTTVSGGRLNHLVIQANGDIQPLYNLGQRLSREGDSQPNVFTHGLLEVVACRDWTLSSRAIETLPTQCRSCEFVDVCRGGIPYTRYSSSNGYSNPTIYCTDYKKMFREIRNMIEADLFEV